MLLHHIVCIIAIISGISIGRFVGNTVVGIFLAEVSTVFLSVRHIIKDLGLHQTNKWRGWYELNGIILVLTFFLCRILYFGYLLFGHVMPYLRNYIDKEEAIESLGWAKV